MGYWLKKYFRVFEIAWTNSFVYRLNFIMWRVRNVLGLLGMYFLWSAVFQDQQVFGWQRQTVLTYILLASVLESIIFSSQTIDLAWKINSGEINNYLLKPISIFKFSFSVDLADKLINLVFSLIEITLLIILLKPDVIWTTSLLSFLAFGLAVGLATVLYFFINFLLGTIGFLSPDVWAPRFIFQIILSFAAGLYFPLEFLPASLYQFIKLTPFNYLIFFPLQIFLQRLTGGEIIKGMLILAAWTFILFYLVRFVWKQGLKKYEAQGI